MEIFDPVTQPFIDLRHLRFPKSTIDEPARKPIMPATSIDPNCYGLDVCHCTYATIEVHFQGDDGRDDDGRDEHKAGRLATLYHRILDPRLRDFFVSAAKTSRGWYPRSNNRGDRGWYRRCYCCWSNS